MAAQGFEVDISRDGMCLSLRCTLDTRNLPEWQGIYSPEFQFGGGGWKLKYYKGSWYNLHLLRCSGVSPDPFHVSVHVESSEDGRTVDVLPQGRHFTTAFKKRDVGCWIWSKREDDVLRSVPEFRLNGILRLVVVLKVGGDTVSKASQTERSVAEASVSTRSTSVQTTLLMSGTPCMESLTKDLDQLRMEGPHHDVEFQCAGHSTKAHKSIVCKRSPVIAAMLATDMVLGRTGVVTIPDMAPDIFAQFLRYLYTGQLEELTFDTALRLYEAGDQYEVLGLAKRCSEYLMDNLSVDNACEVLVVFDAHNNGECVEKVVDFMVENRVPLVSEEWSAFCDEHSKLATKVLNRSLKAAVK